MGGEWKRLSLEEAGADLIDCVHKTPPDAGKGYPYIAIPQTRGGRIDFSANPRRITEEDFRAWTVKAMPRANDVVLSRRCNPGETGACQGSCPMGWSCCVLRVGLFGLVVWVRVEVHRGDGGAVTHVSGPPLRMGVSGLLVEHPAPL